MTDEQTLDEQASDLQGDEPGTENVTVTTDEERIAQLEDQLAGPRNALRAAAEMQNIRRRAEQDIEKAHKFATGKIRHRFVGSAGQS